MERSRAMAQPAPPGRPATAWGWCYPPAAYRRIMVAIGTDLLTAERHLHESS
jgi:hypothetical protein